MSDEITREEVQKLVQNGGRALLLEVLPRDYYERSHLPGAHNAPLDGLERTVQKLAPSLERPLVTYCSGPTCSNSHLAARRLRELGYRDVRVFTGGKAAWREAGLPFESALETTASL